MMIFFCIAGGLLLALLPHLIWFISWLIGKFADFKVGYRPFGYTSLALVVIFWGLMLYGYFIAEIPATDVTT